MFVALILIVHCLRDYFRTLEILMGKRLPDFKLFEQTILGNFRNIFKNFV